MTNDHQPKRTYEGDAAALPNHREKQESKGGHNMKSKRLNEPASEELAPGNTFLAG